MLSLFSFLTPGSYVTPLHTNPSGKDHMIKFLFRSCSTWEFLLNKSVNDSNTQIKIRKRLSSAYVAGSVVAPLLCVQIPAALLPSISPNTWVHLLCPSPQETASALWEKRKALSLRSQGRPAWSWRLHHIK